jgi:hypothetical protein
MAQRSSNTTNRPVTSVDTHPYDEHDVDICRCNEQATAVPSETCASSPAINRPPKAPGPALGPYYQFITTDLHRMLWIGSALIFRHVSFPCPSIEFVSQVNVEYDWEILYENIFDLRAYRLNISIELRDGQGDDEIGWQIDWHDHRTRGSFIVARCKQNWRGGFFSCNGFDATVSEQNKSKLKFSNVWDHLNSVHRQTPFHLLIWGGDQTYIDFIFEDIPELKSWVDIEWSDKWTYAFADNLREQVERYHFNTYAENWERVEVRNALASIPSLMIWDDHDIFDGAGSYPTLLHDSPMMTGLFQTAQKMRLLFQHHTTVGTARARGLFGHHGYNFLAQCGPYLAIVGADGRTERTVDVVQDDRTWTMIFEELTTKLNKDVAHLIVLFPVPFSFLRFKLAESLFDFLKKLSLRCRNVGLVKETNSIFGLPELYDDLLDEWTHDAHLDERNRILQRFQDIAHEKNVRITFFSGDIHCCGIGRFRTRVQQRKSDDHDEKLMYQVISSAIVNLPPPKMATRLAHYVKTKWRPNDNTDEELIDFFDYQPENGRKLWHKKLLPHRNWCYFELCDESNKATLVPVKSNLVHRCFARKHRTASSRDDRHSTRKFGRDNETSHVAPRRSQQTIFEHTNDEHRDKDEHTTRVNLRIRLWLESGPGYRHGRAFASYDLLIPSLL